MNCQQYRREIDETDPAAPGADAAAHAATCAPCRRFADERARLRALVAELEPVGAPPDFEFRLRARLASERRGPGGWLPLRFAPGAAAVALAACFALLVGVALLRRQSADGADALAQQSAGAREAASESTRHDQAVAALTNDVPRVSDASKDDTPRVAEPSHAGGAAGSSNAVAEGKSDAGRNSVRGRRDVHRLTNHEASLASRQERRPALSESPVQASRALSSAPALQTNESAFASAQSFTVGEPIPLPINPSAQSLKVVLRDANGAAHVVAVKPVSFGAEEFANQLNVQRRAAPGPPREGVW
ncbi:MAG TPA: hypothetical protein VER08_06215 [Pyrinomonadaceae bacterium]|nr:hypothetical protein [Pyrinomonadaceae bacterium]